MFPDFPDSGELSPEVDRQEDHLADAEVSGAEAPASPDVAEVAARAEVHEPSEAPQDGVAADEDPSGQQVSEGTSAVEGSKTTPTKKASGGRPNDPDTWSAALTELSEQLQNLS